MNIFKWLLFTLGSIIIFCLTLFLFDLYFDYYINHTIHGLWIIKWPVRILIGCFNVIFFVLSMGAPLFLVKFMDNKRVAFIIAGLIISSYFINIFLGNLIIVTTSGLNDSVLTILKSIICGLGVISAISGAIKS
jgi:hypothetical protein